MNISFQYVCVIQSWGPGPAEGQPTFGWKPPLWKPQARPYVNHRFGKLPLVPCCGQGPSGRGWQSVFELRRNKSMDNQVTISGCLSKFLVVCTYLEYIHIHTYKGEFWLQIYGFPLDNCISIFGCPVIFLVVSEQQKF